MINKATEIKIMPGKLYIACQSRSFVVGKASDRQKVPYGTIMLALTESKRLRWLLYQDVEYWSANFLIEEKVIQCHSYSPDWDWLMPLEKAFKNDGTSK